MGVMTYGMYLIYDTTAPTSAWDPSTHTEGTDYVKFQMSPKRSWNMTSDPRVRALPGGGAYSVTLGRVERSFTIDDIATETQSGYLETFTQKIVQNAYAPYLYMVVVTADGSPPTCRTFYKNQTTSAVYLPVRLSSASCSWDEPSQHYKVKIALEACWT